MELEQRTELLKRMERRIAKHAKYEAGKYSFWSMVKMCWRIMREERKAMKAQQDLANTKQNLN